MFNNPFFLSWTTIANMSIFRSINLPTHCLLTSSAVLGLGLYVAIFRETPFNAGFAYEFAVPNPTTPRVADSNSLLGIVSCALMLPYFLGSYMPIEENQWLHVSVPVRLLLSASLGINLLIRGRSEMSKEGYAEFMLLGAVDLVGALILGRQLGTFSGMVPVSKKGEEMSRTGSRKNARTIIHGSAT